MLRYIVNRLHRIKTHVDEKTFEEIKKGNSIAMEKALRALLLCSNQGLIVKFVDEEKQKMVMRNDSLFRDFAIANRDRVNSNTQVLLANGDMEGLRKVANQIHYKSLKGLNLEEYEVLPNQDYFLMFYQETRRMKAIKVKESA